MEKFLACGRKVRSKQPKLRTRPARWKEGLAERRCRPVRRERWPPADCWVGEVRI